MARESKKNVRGKVTVIPAVPRPEVMALIRQHDVNPARETMSEDGGNGALRLRGKQPPGGDGSKPGGGIGGRPKKEVHWTTDGWCTVPMAMEYHDVPKSRMWNWINAGKLGDRRDFKTGDRMVNIRQVGDLNVKSAVWTAKKNAKAAEKKHESDPGAAEHEKKVAEYVMQWHLERAERRHRVVVDGISYDTFRKFTSAPDGLSPAGGFLCTPSIPGTVAVRPGSVRGLAREHVWTDDQRLALLAPQKIGRALRHVRPTEKQQSKLAEAKVRARGARLELDVEELRIATERRRQWDEQRAADADAAETTAARDYALNVIAHEDDIAGAARVAQDPAEAADRRCERSTHSKEHPDYIVVGRRHEPGAHPRSACTSECNTPEGKALWAAEVAAGECNTPEGRALEAARVAAEERRDGKAAALAELTAASLSPWGDRDDGAAELLKTPDDVKPAGLGTDARDEETAVAAWERAGEEVHAAEVARSEGEGDRPWVPDTDSIEAARYPEARGEKEERVEASRAYTELERCDGPMHLDGCTWACRRSTKKKCDCRCLGVNHGTSDPYLKPKTIRPVAPLGGGVAQKTPKHHGMNRLQTIRSAA
jgi:hypothetical protein